MNQDSPKCLWKPKAEFIEDANLSSYLQWLRDNKTKDFSDYSALWQWSVDHIDEFWASLLEYFDIQYSGSYSEVVAGKMPDVDWFDGVRLSYAEHIFRKRSDQRPALLYKSEDSKLKSLSWQELEDKVCSLQAYLISQGVNEGDRVAAYLPNIPEAIISFLAVNGLGAIWSSTSPDFGTSSVVDRIDQIKPKVLIAVDTYQYGGKSFSKTEAIESIVREIPSITNLILIKPKNLNYKVAQAINWDDIIADFSGNLILKRLPFSQPIWVLYSSGTTGIPKAITHSNGGALLEHLKYLSLHNNVKSGDRNFWYTTIGWMMWNYIQGSLLCGSTVVLYDGSPAYPDMNCLWQLAEEAKISHFGISAGYITACMKSGTNPGKNFNLEHMISLGSTGSPLPPEGFDWIYSQVKEDLWLTSISGGSDVCSAFVGGNPIWPVYSGEIQCRALGCSLEAYDEDGKPLVNRVGEMVITKPMPSMPVYLWGDKANERYIDSYFSMYPNIWRHGDWTKITPRNGVVIYGRSDSTLNRGGVRIGTSEIYRAVDTLEEIEDSLVIYLDHKEDDSMPLFIKVKSGVLLDNKLITRIKSTIRTKTSPRHVPDAIYLAPDIPYTISGKKMETPVKKILQGEKPEKVIKKDAMRNPESINYFIEMAD